MNNDEQKIKSVLDGLADRFQVSRPKLCYSAITRRGRYYYRGERILIGPRCWRGIEQSLVHEFAHHLATKRHGDCGHNARFIAALFDTAAAHFVDPTKYLWRTEYKSIQRWARDMGLVTADSYLTSLPAAPIGFHSE